MPKAILVLNPSSGNGRGKKNCEAILMNLRYAGLDVDLFLSDRAHHAEEFIADLINSNAPLPELIICAGGDGTINEVVNGLSEADGETKKNIGIAIIPLGTANVVAKAFGIPKPIKKCCEVAANGVGRVIDLGTSGIAHEDGKSAIPPRIFLMSSGIGFDGAVTQKMKDVRTANSGHLKGVTSYISPALNAMKDFQFPKMSVDIDGEKFEGISSVIVGNLREYGGPMMFTLKAEPDDGLIDACMFRGDAKTDLVKYFIGGVARRHLGFKDVEYKQGTRISVTTDINVPVQIDGDYAGQLRPGEVWEFVVHPASVKLIVPDKHKG